ncbi:hypothetical protein QBC35DRAFT_383787 [Podospora australis]|uniref:Rhodopsin domain-containing protein n=1 Tax=Podospora australis TaxID=1536484 RepID=A0AAN7AJ51_9PEZI|nr:hypothetical protein QBC35DRAFT_383787 [Podospora australis]
MATTTQPDGTKPDQFAVPIAPTAEELALLPHDDAAPKLIGVVWTLVSISLLFLGLRLYCRMLKRQALWWDDLFLIGAMACMISECCLMTYMTTLGYGLHIWDFPMENMMKLLLPMNISGTLSVVASVWSKTSFGITLLHLTNGWMKKVTWFCIISMNISMGLSAMFPWVSCTPINKVWDMFVEGTCWAPTVLTNYNTFSGAYSAAMDITLAMLPWKFLWGLQMKPKEKIGVGLAMSMGVFAGITSIIKATMTPTAMLSEDFADGIDLWIWANGEVAASIVAACIPMLRVLVKDRKSSRNYPNSGYMKETGLSANRSRMVTIQSRPMPTASDVELHKLGDDDRSDRSILGSNNENINPGKAGIVQVTDFSVKYDDNVANKA